MGRTPKITREKALRSAMTLFWSQGYSATTLDQIQEAVGLQRGSLYSYFESKEKLFHEALELYQEEIVSKRKDLVRNAPSAKEGIELFFSILIDHSIQNRSFPGCLNTNSAAELAVIDKKIASRARLGLKSWEAFWVEIIEQGKSEGDISKNRDSAELARLIITLTQGINVVSKVNPDRTYLNGIAKSGLSLIN